MGVHKLWDILSGAGRTVNLQSLQNRMVAVDTSIWLMNFEHARDDFGNAISNGHLKGLFHRICKLLFFNIRPVFVFDGATPEIKLKTVQRRGAIRSDFALRRAAKKLLKQRIKSTKEKKKNSKSESNTSQDDLNSSVVAIAPGGFIVSDDEESSQGNSQGPDINDYIFDEDDFGQMLDQIKKEEKSEKDLVVSQTPKTPIKSAVQGGDIDSEVFETLPYEIQLEVLNSVKKDMRYQVRKEAKELYKASPSPNHFSELQIQRLIKSNEINKKYKQAKSSIAPDRQSIASEDGTEFVLVRKTPDKSPVPGQTDPKDRVPEFLKSSPGLFSPAVTPVNKNTVSMTTTTTSSIDLVSDEEEPLLRKKHRDNNFNNNNSVVRNLEESDFNEEGPIMSGGFFADDDSDDENSKKIPNITVN